MAHCVVQHYSDLGSQLTFAQWAQQPTVRVNLVADSAILPGAGVGICRFLPLTPTRVD